MLSGSLDKRRRDKFIHGKTTEITSRWWGLVLVEVGASYAYGTRWMTHARCMQIKMAESTQRAGLDAWELRRRGRLPVLLHASPLTTLDLRAPLVRLTAGLQGGYNVY